MERGKTVFVFPRQPFLDVAGAIAPNRNDSVAPEGNFVPEAPPEPHTQAPPERNASAGRSTTTRSVLACMRTAQSRRGGDAEKARGLYVSTEVTSYSFPLSTSH